MTIEEWHEWRREGIGGSDIAALIGLSPYASPTSLYYEKTGQLDLDRTSTDRQRIGLRMESVLAQEFADRTGLYCIAQQIPYVHPDYAYARCTLDGFATESDDLDDALRLGSVQFKTDGRFGWPEGVPAHIRAQCVWEMGVSQSVTSWLVVMFAGFRVEVFELPFDDDARADWEFMRAVAGVFWTLNVEAGIPPPVDDHPATARTLDAIFEADEGAYVHADPDARMLVKVLRDAQAATKAAKAVEDTYRNELRELLGDATELVDGFEDDGKPVVIASWRPQVAHRVDLDALRQAYPDLVEVYTVETPSRVLRLHTKGKRK